MFCKTWVYFYPWYGSHSIAPVWGEYYRIGACPYLSENYIILPL